MNLRAAYTVTADTTVNMGYTLQRHISDDWQYENAGFAPVAQILGSGILPPRYTAHVVSVSVRQGF